VTRYAAAAVALFGLHAPLQCSHDPDPSVRTEDTAGDALWDLAKDFEAHGNHEAAEHTLEMIVKRYPSSRHAPAARDMLDVDGSAAGGTSQTQTGTAPR
jgi:hypothetical protein